MNAWLLRRLTTRTVLALFRAANDCPKWWLDRDGFDAYQATVLEPLRERIRYWAALDAGSRQADR